MFLQPPMQSELKAESSRSPRDGGYGGGCGGFEVFAFLAFLLALLDLILDLNDMNDNAGGGGGTGRRGRFRRGNSLEVFSEENKECKNELDFDEGVWAVGELASGVLNAFRSPPPCDHYHLCNAAAATANRGPLAASLTRLASEWLDKWPELDEAKFGEVIRQASSTLSCNSYGNYNCSKFQFNTEDLFAVPAHDDTRPQEANLWEKLQRALQKYINARRY